MCNNVYYTDEGSPCLLIGVFGDVHHKGIVTCIVLQSPLAPICTCMSRNSQLHSSGLWSPFFVIFVMQCVYCNWYKEWTCDSSVLGGIAQ